MTRARLNRLFADDGRCFDVAIDHGFFGEASFLRGIEDAAGAVATVIDAGPDALQLSLGQAPLLQEVRGPRKPALVLRSDIANVYGKRLPERLFSHLVDDIVTHAVRLDAACLCVNLFDLEGAPEVHEQCVHNITRVKAAADPLGMPVMVEPLVMQRGEGGYGIDGRLEAIATLVRQAVELGADVIKADPCDELERYHEVIAVAGRVPVLVRGGGRVSDEEILRRTKTVMAQGASGIVYGRNVVQHERPAAITRALMAVVHQDAELEHAAAIARGEA